MTTAKIHLQRLREPLYKLATRLRSIAAIAETKNLQAEDKRYTLDRLLGEVTWHVNYLSDKKNLPDGPRQVYDDAFRKTRGIAETLGALLNAGGVEFEHDPIYAQLYKDAEELALLARAITL